jgi:hypothetical protein
MPMPPQQLAHWPPPSSCICMFSCDFPVSSQKRFPELKEARQAWDERLPGAQWDDQTEWGDEDPF